MPLKKSKSTEIAKSAANKPRNSESGLTIIELAVSVVIFTIVTASVYALLEVARNGRLNTHQRTDTLHNVRVALNTLGRDTLNAGVGYENVGARIPNGRLLSLFQTPDDLDPGPDSLTPIAVANNVNPINRIMTDRVTFVYTDDSFNNDASLSLDPVTPLLNLGAQLRIDTRGADRIAGTPDDVTNSIVSVNDIYLVTGANGWSLGQVTGRTGTDRLDFSAAPALGFNLPGVNNLFASINPTSITRVIVVSYLVIDDGTGSGTLVRRVYGGSTGWNDQPLAFGVEDFQIVYVLADGSVVNTVAANQMGLVRQVRATINVRSPDINPKTNQPYRSTLTASYSTRNLGYEKRI